MAQRITRLTTDQKIAGSNPAEIENLLHFMFLTTRLENRPANHSQEKDSILQVLGYINDLASQSKIISQMQLLLVNSKILLAIKS